MHKPSLQNTLIVTELGVYVVDGVSQGNNVQVPESLWPSCLFSSNICSTSYNDAKYQNVENQTIFAVCVSMLFVHEQKTANDRTCHRHLHSCFLLSYAVKCVHDHS